MCVNFRKSTVSFGWIALVLALVAACTSAAPSTRPEATPAPAPTRAAASAPPAAPTQSAAPAAPTAKPAGPSEWIVAIAEEAPTLDPAWTSSLPARTMQIHLFDGLVGIESQDLKVVPMLAESWSRIDDRTWEFKIRKGVKFHNGDDFTAADVKYSLDLHKSEKSQNRTYLAEVTSVDLVDQYTIRLTTRGPNPTMLGNLGTLLMMPRQAREKAGDDAFARSPIGTGPYKFVEFVRGQRLVLEANPNYWRGPVNPKKLTFRPILDPSTRVAELKSGGAQIIIAPPPARFKEIESGDTQLMPLKAGRLIIHPFNTKEKPFDDARVRQAVNHAVDRDGIIKGVLEGYGEPLHGPFASPWLGYDPSLKPYPYDQARAKQLLADAGYPNGFETTFSISSGAFLKDREIAEAVASQLAKVGIKVQLVPTERAKLIEDWNNGVHKGITSVAWGTTLDPDTMLGFALYKRKAYKPDEKLDSLVEQSRRTVDPDQRKKILQELGRYVHDQAYWMFIHAQDEFYAKRKDIQWVPFPLANSFGFSAYYQVPGT